MNIKDIILKHEDLISTCYFQDLENPKTCKVCALGALIQALPEEQFNECIKHILSPNGADEMFFNKNSRNIQMPDMKPVRDILNNYYGEALTDYRDRKSVV